MIPDGRVLCHFCTRTAALAHESPAQTGSGISCPICPGIINEVDHFTTSGHLLAVRMTTDDQRLMAQIARDPTR